MRILSIGNSFSEDAQRWLCALARSSGDEAFECHNLYIGGCSLRRHMREHSEGNAAYDYMINGGVSLRKISLDEALIELGEFDAITFQQTSRTCGQPQSYLPYLTELAATVREKQPRAKLYFHETWAYETDSTHSAFVHYNHDQGEMFRRLVDCAEMCRLLIDCDVIRAGEFIQYLRENVARFDYKNGGPSLNRDGYHLSKNYGRAAAALVWQKEFCAGAPDIDRFIEIANAEMREGDLPFERDILAEIFAAFEEFSKPDEAEE